jgi:hypothetical protein
MVLVGGIGLAVGRLVGAGIVVGGGTLVAVAEVDSRLVAGWGEGVELRTTGGVWAVSLARLQARLRQMKAKSKAVRRMRLFFIDASL